MEQRRFSDRMTGVDHLPERVDNSVQGLGPTASDFLVVFVTAPAHEQAEHIAELLVAERLAACVTIVPNVSSCYRWQGELCKDQESLLIIKTRAALFAQLEAAVRRAHPYQVPEILALPVSDGARGYLQWLLESTRREQNRG